MAKTEQIKVQSQFQLKLFLLGFEIHNGESEYILKKAVRAPDGDAAWKIGLEYVSDFWGENSHIDKDLMDEKENEQIYWKDDDSEFIELNQMDELGTLEEFVNGFLIGGPRYGWKTPAAGIPRTKEALDVDGETGEDYILNGDWAWIKVPAPKDVKLAKGSNNALLVKIKKTTEGAIVDVFNDQDLKKTGGTADSVATLSAMYED